MGHDNCGDGLTSRITTRAGFWKNTFMSAIVSIRGDDGVVIAADTISYSTTGEVLSLTACKVLPVLEMNCVIGNVGIGGFTTTLRDCIGAKYIDFDEMLLGIVDDFRIVHEHFVDRSYAEFAGNVNATVMVAGWSEKNQRFETFRISSRQKEIVVAGESSWSSAFSLVETPGCWVSSAYRQVDCERFGINWEEEGPNLVDLAQRIICACRAASSASGSGDFEGLPYAVGGQLQVTLLQKNHITQWVAHRWPDQIGELVNPEAGDPMPQRLRPHLDGDEG